MMDILRENSSPSYVTITLYIYFKRQKLISSLLVLLGFG